MAHPKRPQQAADLNMIAHWLQTGRPDLARPALAQWLARNPLHAQALKLQGDLLSAEGALQAALDAYLRSLAQQQSAITSKAAVAVAQALQRHDVLAGQLRLLIRLEPQDGHHRFNLAQLLKRDAASAAEAVALLQQCIELGSMVKESYCQIGMIAHSPLQQRDLARSAFLQALALDAGYIDARIGLANLYCENNLVEEALQLLQQAVADTPQEQVRLYKTLGVSLQKLGRGKESLAFMQRALALMPDNSELFSNYLFMATYTDELSDAEWLAQHQQYGAMVARQAQAFSRFAQSAEPQRRLKLGFVSADFRTHSVNYFFEPLLQALDQQQLEVVCYYTDTQRDEVTARLQALASGWHDVAGLSNEALARQIHQDRIDILIDLGVHSPKNRLPAFAWRPAPVQMSWLGYPATTGVKEIDYLLLDRYYLPADAVLPAVEKPLLLNSYRVFQPLDDMHKLPVKPLPALEKGYITFGSFNDFVKISLSQLQLWAQLLQRIPDARLVMIVHARESTDYIQRFFAGHGIAAERLMLFTKLSFSHFLQLHHYVDIALDTYPFTGLTTCIHGLWMGVPPITLAGSRSTSRSGLSLLAPLGLKDFVAGSAEEYLQKAEYWATQLPRLANIRSGLRQQLQQSPLMDGPAFATDFAATMRRAWHHWCSTAGQ